MKIFIKRTCFLLLLLISYSNYSHAQEKVIMGCSKNYDFNSNFSNSTDTTNNYFIIDTSNANNIWEIGNSPKMNFGPNYGLMTSLTKNYPENNVSSFKIGVVTCSGLPIDTPGFYHSDISINYFCRTEKNKDGVVVETKLNSNGTWRNIVTDTNIYISIQFAPRDSIESAGNMIGFSGFADNRTLQIIGIYPVALNHAFDTIWIRFTFYSDSVKSNYYGFNISNLSVNGVFSGIENTKFVELDINPNPTTGIIEIKNLPQQINSTVEIYSIHGKQLQNYSILEQGEIDITSFEPGIYLLKMGNKQKRIVKY